MAVSLFGCLIIHRGIYYIPFDAKDIGAVTAKSIKDKAMYKLIDPPEDLRAELIIHAVGEPGTRKWVLDKNNIRIRIDKDREALLVDAHGVASWAGYSGPANLSFLNAAIKGLRFPERSDEIQESLASAAGPSPWYRGTQNEIIAKARRFHWTGKFMDTLTEVGVEKPLLGLGMYAYFIPLNEGRLLVWGKEYAADGKADRFVLAIYDVALLKPLREEVIPGKKEEATIPFVAGTEPIERVYIDNNLASGVYRGFKLHSAGGLMEVMLLASAAKDSGLASSIYILNPLTGELRVLPQKWFTANFYDLGYAWITQVRRDPKSHRIIGSGIRLPYFELDESGTELDRLFIPVQVEK